MKESMPLDGQDNRPVVIIGGGLVGSLAAIYVARLGYKVSVYEKRPDMRGLETVEGRSINLALSERGVNALCGVGLDAKVLSELAIPMRARMIHLADRPFRLQAVPYGDFGQHINSISRRGLNELLLTEASKCPHVAFYFEHELVQIDARSASASFRNTRTGTIEQVQAHFILGCDGAYSAARRELMKHTRLNFSQEYVRHGYKELCIPADEGGRWQLEANFLHIWPRKEFMLIALPNTDGSFTATLFYPHECFEKISSDEDIIRFFAQNFPDFLDLFGKERLIAEYRANPVGPLATMRCSHYHVEDKLLILGDAAHAMVPFYGQGMNAGFEDVVVLDSLLKQHPRDVALAFSEYSRLRRPDAHAICDLALYNYWEMSTAMVSPWFLLKKRIYSLLHRLMPRAVVPLYTMVAFSNIPYSQALARHLRQETILNATLCAIGVGVVASMGYYMCGCVSKIFN